MWVVYLIDASGYDWGHKYFKYEENARKHFEMLEKMKHTHQWTRNITPPSTPKRYDPNEPPFDPSEFLGDMDDDNE